jgi:hypothetical protein
MVKTTRKHTRKTRKAKTRRQRGAGCDNFQVYLFTKTPSTELDHVTILSALTKLYGDEIAEITNYNNFPNNFLRDDITEFVHSKGRHYPSLTEITGFSIPPPPELQAGSMNDAKITREEYKIRDYFKENEIPFKLVKVPHGLWSEGVAIIAIERL